VTTLSGSSNSGNSFASIEGGLAESTPADGANTAAGGLTGPALAPGAALAPNSRSSGSAALQSQNGGNASASIEGIPANGGSSSSTSSPSGPALAPSAALAPTPSFNVTDLAGTKSQLSQKWWLWLLVALATLATWLCCCCCMGAVVVLLHRRKRRIM